MALEYLEWAKAEMKGTRPGLLVHIIGDMPRERTGIEVGFLSTIDRAAPFGFDHSRRLNAFLDKRVEELQAKEASAA